MGGNRELVGRLAHRFCTQPLQVGNCDPEAELILQACAERARDEDAGLEAIINRARIRWADTQAQERARRLVAAFEGVVHGKIAAPGPGREPRGFWIAGAVIPDADLRQLPENNLPIMVA
jgi:hypothetical protein